MPRTTFNKALSHAIRSRYDLSNWRRSLRKIEEETKSIRYSVAINIGSNGRVNDGRVGVKSPRIERRLSTINQPTNQPASQPVTKLLEGYGKRVESWNVGHRDCEQPWWSPRCSLCVFARVCPATFQWPISKCESASERKRRKTDIGFCRGRNWNELIRPCFRLSILSPDERLEF